MIEATANETIAYLIAICVSLASTGYALAKRVQLKEALGFIETIKEVTHVSSEDGEDVSLDEKIRIADEVIEIFKE